MSYGSTQIPGTILPVEVLDPATDAAGRTGLWSSLKNYTRATIVAHIQQGNAATIALSLLQAQDVSGTASKALTATLIWTNLDTSAGRAYTSQTAASSFTTDAALKNKVVIFQVDAAALDQANSFDCVTISTGASNVANVTQAMIYLSGARYQQTATAQPDPGVN